MEIQFFFLLDEMINHNTINKRASFTRYIKNSYMLAKINEEEEEDISEEKYKNMISLKFNDFYNSGVIFLIVAIILMNRIPYFCHYDAIRIVIQYCGVVLWKSHTSRSTAEGTRTRRNASQGRRTRSPGPPSRCGRSRNRWGSSERGGGGTPMSRGCSTGDQGKGFGGHPHRRCVRLSPRTAG